MFRQERTEFFQTTQEEGNKKKKKRKRVLLPSVVTAPEPRMKVPGSDIRPQHRYRAHHR